MSGTKLAKSSNVRYNVFKLVIEWEVTLDEGNPVGRRLLILNGGVDGIPLLGLFTSKSTEILPCVCPSIRWIRDESKDSCNGLLPAFSLILVSM